MSELAAVVVSSAITFTLACVSVSLWTLRVAVTSAGRRVAGASVAGVEAVVFAVAFGRIVTDVGDPAGLAAYAAGVCAGTLLGLIVDQRLSTGQSWVRVIVEGDGDGLAASLIDRQWPVTSVAGVGPAGPVTQLLVGVDDARLLLLLRDLDTLAPRAFRTVERLRTAHAPNAPVGLRQMGERRTWRPPLLSRVPRRHLRDAHAHAAGG